jgi:penicillin amidase
VLPGPLANAWASATSTAGADPRAWRWDTLHGTRGRHNLSAAFPERAAEFDPPRAMVGGDSDTIQCAAFTWSGRADFNLSNTSVYRQAVDLADIDRASFVIPGGASGVPGHRHYTDQLDLWRTHQRIPMHYREQDVNAATVTSLRLVPDR